MTCKIKIYQNRCNSTGFEFTRRQAVHLLQSIEIQHSPLATQYGRLFVCGHGRQTLFLMFGIPRFPLHQLPRSQGDKWKEGNEKRGTWSSQSQRRLSLLTQWFWCKSHILIKRSMTDVKRGILWHFRFEVMFILHPMWQIQWFNI